MSNFLGQVADGSCCGGAARADATVPCPSQCNTRFRVCLKEYQSNVTSSGSCSFGNSSSPVLGGNSFTLADPDRASGNLVLPFSFRWTVSCLCFYLWVEEIWKRRILYHFGIHCGFLQILVLYIVAPEIPHALLWPDQKQKKITYRIKNRNSNQMIDRDPSPSVRITDELSEWLAIWSCTSQESSRECSKTFPIVGDDWPISFPRWRSFAVSRNCPLLLFQVTL